MSEYHAESCHADLRCIIEGCSCACHPADTWGEAHGDEYDPYQLEDFHSQYDE